MIEAVPGTDGLKHCGTIEIHTERLVLRRYFISDAQDMFETYCTDEEVTRYLTWTPHEDIHETMRLIAEWTDQYASLDTYNWAIEYDSHVIGGIGTPCVSNMDKRIEVGYCIGKQYWGRGIVPEAMSAVLELLIGRVGYNRVEAKHDVLNPASGRVMQKVGMHLEGCLRQLSRRRDGSFGDHYIYSILKEDYIKP